MQINPSSAFPIMELWNFFVVVVDETYYWKQAEVSVDQ